MQSGNSRLLCAAVTFTAILMVAGGSGATALGRGGNLPPLPPLPPPSDRAAFKLVVEGSGDSQLLVSGSGSNGVCDIATSTNSVQDFEYGRGKDVRVVFSKYKFRGAPPLVLVKGKRGLRFTVVGSYTNGASGSAGRSGPDPPCVPVNETAGDETGCGPSGAKRTIINLTSTFEGKLALTPVATSPGTPGTGCGSNGVESLSGTPHYSWPYFAPLKKEPMPTAKIFGKTKRFKVDFASGRIGFETFSPIGSFEIRSINSGSHEAVARFIRDGKN